MLRRVAIVLLLFGLVVGACGDAGELGGPAVGGTLAAKVGDLALTNADLQDETELWASNPDFLAQIGIVDQGVPGRRSAELVAFVLSHRLVSEQAAQLGAEAGYEPTQGEIDQILGQLIQGFGDVFTAFPESFQQQLGRDLAYQNNLQFLAVDAVAPSVELNPRYGTLEDVQSGLVQVRPPDGPLPEPLAAEL